MKRTLSLLLALCMTLGFFTAYQAPQAAAAEPIWKDTWTGNQGDLVRIHQHTKGSGIPIIIMPSHFSAGDLAAGGKLQQASEWARDITVNAGDTHIFGDISQYYDIYVYLRSDSVAPVPSSGYVDRFMTTHNGVNFNNIAHDLAIQLGKSGLTIDVKFIHLGNSDGGGDIGGHAYAGGGAMLAWGNRPGTSTPWQPNPVWWALHEFWGHGVAALGDEYEILSFESPNLYRKNTTPADDELPWKNFIGFKETFSVTGMEYTHGKFTHANADYHDWFPTAASFMGSAGPWEVYVPMYHKWVLYEKTMALAGLFVTLKDFSDKMGITLPVPYVVTEADRLRTAIANGNPYTMNENLTLTSQLDIPRDFTLDLNGRTMTINITSGSGIRIAAGATLTITDSGSGGTLNIPARANDGAGVNTTNATLIINGGIINANAGGWSAGIGGTNNPQERRDNGTVIINSGTVTAAGQHHGAGIGGAAEGGGGTVIINGGTVTATGGGSSQADIGRGTAGSNGTNVRTGGTVTAARVVPEFITDEFAPVIGAQPSNQTVAEGKNAVFTIAAGAWPLPTYQWQVSTNDGATWTDMTGAASATLTLTSVTIDGHDGNQYRCIVTNTKGTVTSNAATLTVSDEPEPGEPGVGTISLTDAPAPHINLTAETIDLGSFSVAAYSLDGGKKWRKGELPTDKKLTGLFNKGFTLHVASAWNDKDIKEGKTVLEKKGVAKDATVIKFPKIDKRPKSNPEKLKPFYGEEKWHPRKGGTGELSNPSDYEWAASSDGKTPSGDWTALDGDGFALKEPGTKETVLLRTVPVAEDGKYVPACKPFRVKPKAMGKEPNLKANEKKGILKLKKGMFYQVGDGTPVGGASGAAAELKIVASASGTGQVTGGSTITVWTAATGKKPPSAKQTLTLPAAPEAP